MRGLRSIPPAFATRAALTVALVLVPALAGASVELKPGPAGRKVITNENEAQRARRLAPHMVEPSEADLLPVIERHARDRGLDPALVRAVVQAESGYNAGAVSTKGALGLMQLMPATAVEMAVASPFDPEENLRGGTRYLRALLERFGGDVILALAAYNAGPSTVERYGGVPPYPETVEYVRRVLSLWRGGPGPRIVPARSRSLPPAKPVVWKTDGERAHLTNIEQ